MTHHPTNKENEARWHKVIVKAWMDENFKQKLLAHPAEVLKEHGVEPPHGFTFKVHENTHVIHLILPKKIEGKMSETDLRKVAGSTSCNTGGESYVCN